MEEDNSLSSVYFMLVVNSHVSMQRQGVMWLWGKCVLCVTVEVIMDLKGETFGETFPLFMQNRSVWVCVYVFNFPFAEFNVVERIKETRQMAYPQCLISRDHLNWDMNLTQPALLPDFLKNLVVGPVNVWNCEVGRSIQAMLFCLTFSHNHFEFTDPLPWLPTFLLKLYSLLPGFASERPSSPLFLCWRHLI